jgi:hypothetical protein
MAVLFLDTKLPEIEKLRSFSVNQCFLKKFQKLVILPMGAKILTHFEIFSKASTKSFGSFKWLIVDFLIPAAASDWQWRYHRYYHVLYHSFIVDTTR